MQPVDWRTRRPGFQRWSYNGFHSSRSLASPAFGGCSFLRDSRAERHSAVQRSPRSHSSASLRSRSAVALSSWARASLRYRIARALLMASQIPRNRRKEDSSTGKRFGSGQPGEPCRAVEALTTRSRVQVRHDWPAGLRRRVTSSAAGIFPVDHTRLPSAAAAHLTVLLCFVHCCRAGMAPP